MMQFALAHPWLSFFGFIIGWSITCELINKVCYYICSVIETYVKEKN